MFDFLCALAAIGNACIQVMTVKMAAEPQPEKKKQDLTSEYKESSEKKETRAYKDAYPRKDKAATGYKHMYARKMHLQTDIGKNTSETKGKISVGDWCSENMELIIDLVEPGEHVIKNEVLGTVDTEQLSDALFKCIDNLESIDKTEDGLIIRTRYDE